MYLLCHSEEGEARRGNPSSPERVLRIATPVCGLVRNDIRSPLYIILYTKVGFVRVRLHVSRQVWSPNGRFLSPRFFPFSAPSSHRLSGPARQTSRFGSESRRRVRRLSSAEAQVRVASVVGQYPVHMPSPGGRWPSKARSDEGWRAVRFSAGLQQMQYRKITARIPHQSKIKDF